MSRQVQISSLAIDQFPVWELDGYSKKSGETVFTTTLWRDGVVSLIPVTIAEIGVSGEYRASFTPNLRGLWILEVKVPYNGQVWGQTFDVGSDHAESQLIVAYEETTDTLYMDVWLDRDGTSVPSAELVSCSIEVFDPDGVSVFTASSNLPDPDGKFRMSRVQILLDNRTYGARILVVDVRGPVTTSQAFTTIR